MMSAAEKNDDSVEDQNGKVEENAVADSGGPSTGERKGNKKKLKNLLKKKNKGKEPATTEEQTSSAGTDLVPPELEKELDPETRRKYNNILERMKIVENLESMRVSGGNPEQKARKIMKDMKEYKFWQTQPVTRTDEDVLEEGPIVPDAAHEDLQKEPYPLPKDFEWCLVDVDNDAQIKELYELLSLNYVEDDDAMFRFDYSADFLKWALKPPGWKQVWHLGVRVVKNKKLVAFISGIPATLRAHQHQQLLVEINFLCVHKKLRSKRLAPVMIKEVTRRVNLEGIFQATYTAGVFLPTPISTCRYYHRSLNPKKLIETSFSHLQRNMTMARTIRLYKLPEEPTIPGLRPMTKNDVPAVTTLLNEYLATFRVAPTFTEEEVSHWVLPLPGVVFSYVVEDPETKQIDQFVSFYSLPSTVIGHPVHRHINAAYLFYYVPKGKGADPKALHTLIKDALILAKMADFDVFNCLDLMQNGTFVDDLKFGKGDGNLHYYLYNYRCRSVKPNELALVLL